MTNSIDLLEQKLIFHIQETKKRKKASKKSKIEHYFAGQYDAFTQALLELRMLKYELNMPEAEDADLAKEDVVVASKVAEPAMTEQFEADKEAVEARPARKKPAPKRKKAQPKEALSPEVLAAQDLLQRAVQAGVITQKISLYVYEDFPDGRVRGKIQAAELLSNAALAEKVAQQIAEKQAA